MQKIIVKKLLQNANSIQNNANKNTKRINSNNLN